MLGAEKLQGELKFLEEEKLFQRNGGKTVLLWEANIFLEQKSKRKIPQN